MAESDRLFSVKMRASAADQHISGAERFVPETALRPFADVLLERALSHSKGKPDFINLKFEAVGREKLRFLDALPVSTCVAASPADGLENMRVILSGIGIGNAEQIVRTLVDAPEMRGAMLLNVDTLERMESDTARGVRVTYMDAEAGLDKPLSSVKNHYAEAIVLATKVANAPHIVAELCISDDPGYVTGYIASKTTGYVRITPLKEKGSPHGGRVFLFRGTAAEAAETIEFLEKTPVLVRGVQPLQTSCKPEKWELVEKRIRNLREAGLFRETRMMESAQSAHVMCGGRDCIMLASNDYLDLAAEQSVRHAAADAVLKYGAGSGGSRLTTGNLRLHEELESEIAAFKGEESAILFNTGYMANIGTIAAFAGKCDTIFSDELNHASIIDGCRLSRAKVVVYRHNDMIDLEAKIAANPVEGVGLIVSDAVFSMDGDIVNLPEFVAIAERHGFFSMVDEAHSTGVLGATGRGVVEHFGGAYRPDIVMGTLSKSFGSLGGFVCGRSVLSDFLRNTARSYIFSTSLTPADIAAATAAIRYLAAHPELPGRLRRNSEVFCWALCRRGIKVNPGTAIVPVIIGDENLALDASKKLLDRGYIIPAIRYPTVPRGSARLRVALMATHTEAELVAAANAIADVFK